MRLGNQASLLRPPRAVLKKQRGRISAIFANPTAKISIKEIKMKRSKQKSSPEYPKCVLPTAPLRAVPPAAPVFRPFLPASFFGKPGRARSRFPPPATGTAGPPVYRHRTKFDTPSPFSFPPSAQRTCACPASGSSGRRMGRAGILYQTACGCRGRALSRIVPGRGVCYVAGKKKRRAGAFPSAPPPQRQGLGAGAGRSVTANAWQAICARAGRRASGRRRPCRQTGRGAKRRAAPSPGAWLPGGSTAKRSACRRRACA